MYLTDFRICPNICLDLKQKTILNFLNLEYDTGKSNTLLIRSARMCVHPDLKDLVDTLYTRPCTDVNTDCILRLQHHQDTYITHCIKIWL